eukprot:TRINITY_DN287_c2_g1_i1.p1 TRINITY_DN287_c2_g1~~TRINITY_DN287_c2_g1_i1.p1  ORF type:complete len:407 (-),score=84.74 TRINITY_DN287_c2_g1_i1:806-2026(-)
MARWSSKAFQKFEHLRVFHSFSQSLADGTRGLPGPSAQSFSSISEGISVGGKPRPKIGLSALVLLLPPAITLTLGTWQIQRRQEKIELLDRRRKQLDEPPLALATTARSYDGKQAAQLEGKLAGGETVAQSALKGSEDSAHAKFSGLEYRRVEAEGRWDEKKTIFVGPRAKSVYGVAERGYYVVTPFLPSDANQGPAVLINRGWVPGAWRDEFVAKSGSSSSSSSSESEQQRLSYTVPSSTTAATATSSASGTSSSSWWGRIFGSKDSASALKQIVPPPPALPPPQVVCGVVRSSEVPNSFVPPNDPSTGQWFWVDIPRMAQACGLPANALLLDLLPSKSESDEEAIMMASKGGANPGMAAAPIPKNPSELLQQRVMPNDHLMYTATWYTLCLATSYLAYKRLRMP